MILQVGWSGYGGGKPGFTAPGLFNMDRDSSLMAQNKEALGSSGGCWQVRNTGDWGWGRNGQCETEGLLLARSRPSSSVSPVPLLQ